MKAYTYMVNGQQVEICDYGIWGVTVSGHSWQYDNLEQAEWCAGVQGLKPVREEVYPD